MATELTWHDVLAEEKQQPYFVNTLHTVAGERQSGMTIYPPQKDVFNAFRFTELGDVKVVILGQDPYHGPGQAHGLAFSVRPGIATPPSLLNMYKELEATIPRLHPPHARISGKLGTPGGTVTQHRTHRSRRSGTFSRQPWMGNLYR